MDFGLREILILVGLVVIAGIVFDGYRRMRKSKLGELELPSEMGGSCEDDWEYYKGELPNGGARKIPLSVRRSVGEADFEEGFGSALDGSDPDMDEFQEEDVVAERRSHRVEEPQPKPVAQKTKPAAAQPEQDYIDDLVQEDQVQEEGDSHTQADLFSEDEMLLRAKADQQAKLAKKTGGKSQARKHEPEVEIDPNLQEVLVLNIMARQGEFKGEDLMRVLLSCGFRFGDMNIFHRYEQHSGKGGLLFSAANVVEPGIFDVDNMSEFNTPGICIFMKLPGPKRPIHAFDILMDSARKIANLLDADVKDEHHNVMRQQTAEHYRQRVLDFERKFLSYKASQKQI